MHWITGSVIAAYGLCAIILLFAAILRLRCGSWSNPSVVFALFWGLMTLMPIFFVPEIQQSVPAIVYITAAVLAFGLPVLAFDWRQPLTEVATRGGSGSPFLSGNQALGLLLLIQVTVLACMMANVAYQGFSVRDFLVDPFAIGCKYLGYRYNGDVKPFALAQAATVVNYVAAALAGLIVAHRQSYLLSTCIVLLCMLPSLYSVAIYADKGTIFLTLAFFYGAVVVGRIRNGSTALLTRRSILSAPLILLVVTTVIGFAMFNRMSGLCEDSQTNKLASEMMSSFTSSEPGEAIARNTAGNVNEDGSTLKFYIRSYAFGHLFAFSSWFDHRISGGQTLPSHTVPNPEFRPQWNTPGSPLLYRNPEGPTYGFWTFLAIGKHINKDYFASLPEGYYEEYLLRPGILQTNIYTFFRGLINDFTLPGSLVAMALFGLIFNFVYRNILLNAYASLSQTLYIFFAGYLYTSYIISLLIWSSVIASGMVTFVILALINYVDRRGGALTNVLSGRHLRSSEVGRSK